MLSDKLHGEQQHRVPAAARRAITAAPSLFKTQTCRTPQSQDRTPADLELSPFIELPTESVFELVISRIDAAVAPQVFVRLFTQVGDYSCAPCRVKSSPDSSGMFVR